MLLNPGLLQARVLFWMALRPVRAFLQGSPCAVITPTPSLHAAQAYSVPFRRIALNVVSSFRQKVNALALSGIHFFLTNRRKSCILLMCSGW